MKKILLLATVLLLSACATRSVDSGFAFEPKAQDGVITGSVSYAGRFSGYAVHYRNVATGESGRLQIGESQALLPIFPKDELGDPNAVGQVFAVKLPAGEYEATRWTVGSGAANVASTTPFAIRFKVNSGSLTYVGSFQFTQVSGMGLTVTGATLAFKDAATRDLAIMRRKFPKLADAPLSFAVTPGTEMADVGGRSSLRFTPPTYVQVKPR